MTLLSALVIAAVAATYETKMTEARAKVANPSFRVLELHATRVSPLDLEVIGELPGIPTGAARYVTRDDLLALPQVKYTVSDDDNFAGPTVLSGVSLEDLMHHLGVTPATDLVVAICDDGYRTHYPRAYLAKHHPFLVLEVNGKPPAGWPKDSEGHGLDMGPYMISHPQFTPSFKIHSYADEAQIPWGVVRLEFRDEQEIFGPIAPRGADASQPGPQAGYRIAQQNCFRCHNQGVEGGQKSRISWTILSALAASSPDLFASYVRNPQARNPEAQMPGNPGYDQATTDTLIRYFATFSKQRKP
jgi:mono/diheme cytochrome c family protein